MRGEGDGVGAGHAWHLRAQETDEGEGQSGAHHEADRGELHAGPEHETQDVCRPSAQGEADAELGRAVRDQVRDDPVEAHRSTTT